MNKNLFFSFILSLSFILFLNKTNAQLVTHDSTFATNGITTNIVAGSDNEYYDVMLSPSQDIYCTGYKYFFNNVALISKYTSSGALDMTFGVNGICTIGNTSDDYYLNRSDIDTSGKIVSCGSWNDASFTLNGLLVSRVKTNGTLDSSFATNGIYKYSLPGSQYTISSDIEIQQDGKILIVGYYYDASFNMYSFVMRLDPSGVIDPSFGTAGIYTAPSTNSLSFNCVKLTSTNKILLGGYLYNTSQDVALLQLNSNGTIDATYGTSGYATLPISGSNDEDITYFEVTPTDDVVFVGGRYDNSVFYSDVVIGKVNSNGSFDNTFNTVGYTIFGVGNSSDNYARKITLQTDLKPVILSQNYTSSANSISIIRYKTDGTLDSSFNFNGIKNIYTSNNNINGYSAAVQNDNKILYCGSDYNSSSFSVLGRLKVDSNSTPSTATIISPNGGEIWSSGTVHNITWTSSNVSAVNLEYSDDNGFSWNSIANGVNASTGSFSWTLPLVSSTTALVRISDATNGMALDVSDAVFTIFLHYVEVTSPNGGEIWTGGTNQTISWNFSNVANVNISYSTNGGFTWTNIANNVNATPSFYNWTIPNTPSSNCFVKIVDAADSTVYDISNSAFAINPTPGTIQLTAPNGGEQWLVGSSQNITWTSTNITNVSIRYSVNGGTTWNLVVNSTPAATGSYSWTIPNNVSSNCLIWIWDLSNPSVSDQSNATFSIVNSAPASITLTTPNGGEIWTTNSNQNITWTSTNVTNVDLSYSTNGATWVSIANNITASTGTYAWTIPNTPSTNCWVKIVDASNSAVVDSSNAKFSIVWPTSISNINSSNLASVSPNPANSILKIDLKNNINSQIFMQDIKGNTIFKASTSSKLDINTSDFANGIYNLTILNKEGKQSQKIVIQH